MTGIHADRGRAALAVVLVLGATLVALAVQASPHFSHIDEVQHFDYLERVSRGRLVHRGDRIGEASMREMACRGIDVDATKYQNLYGQAKELPRCNAPTLNPDDFPERGFNTAYIHPPAYYVATGLVARAIRALTPIGSLFVAARVVGILWLWLTILLLWRLLSAFEVPLRWKVLLSVIIVSSPGVLSRVVNVNPDATAVMAGTAVILGAVLWERRASAWWVPVTAAALAIGLKETNVIGVALATLFLGFMALKAFRDGDRPHAKRCVLMVAAMLVAGATVGAIWQITIDRTARIPLSSVPQMQRLQADHLSAREALGQAGSNLFLLNPRQPPSFPLSDAAEVAGFMGNWLLLGSAIVTVSLGVSAPRLRAVTGAALVTLVVSGPVLVLIYYTWGGFVLEIPSRYALSALPAIPLGAAFVFRRRLHEGLCAGFAVFQVAVIFATLFV